MNTIKMLVLIILIICIVSGFKYYKKLLLSLKQYNNYYENNYLNSNVYIKNSKYGGTGGRGVFANKDFKKNDIVEIAPFILDKYTKVKGNMKDYIFAHGDDVALVLGLVSLYNHSDDPNVIINFVDSYVNIIAVKDINKDEEILISYGKGYWESRDIAKIN